MAASLNVLQLSQQTTAADTSSVLYAARSGSIDTGLPFSVFVNNIGLTGTPTVPTAAPGTNTTQIASTAFVQAAVGAYAPLTGANFTGVVTITTTNLTDSFHIIDTGTNGANMCLTGNGGVTPSKFLRVNSGSFGIVNNAYSTQILTLTDAGSLTTTGGLNGTPVGNSSASTGAFTTLSASSTVSGAGFGLLFASPPVIGQTVANAATFTTLTSTGIFTPSQTNGIAGTTTNNNANAGSVGEYMENTGTAVSLSTGVSANITSLSLTAGDWEVGGSIAFTPAGSTNITGINGSISQTSATPAAVPLTTQWFATFTTGLIVSVPVPTRRILLSGSATVFLVGNCAFNTSTCTGTATIWARRPR